MANNKSNKNATKMKVAKKPKLTEEEKKQILEEDIKEFKEVYHKAIKAAKTHLDKPQKFLESLTSARMFFGEHLTLDEIGFGVVEIGIAAIKDVYNDVDKALDNITYDSLMKKEDPFVDLLKTVDYNKPSKTDVFYGLQYNTQLNQFGSDFVNWLSGTPERAEILGIDSKPNSLNN